MVFQTFIKWFPLLFLRRSKTPNLIQVEATECGSVALAIIMGYYKRFVAAEEVRQMCGVNRNGSKALNIIKAARNYGMIANGAETEDITTVDAHHFPLIAFWEFNHFIVVEEVVEGCVYINDPAQGFRCLPLEEFNKSFTGIIILVKLGEDFKEEGIHPYSLSPLKALLKQYKPIFAFLIALALAAAIPAIAIPGFATIFIDDILTKQLDEWFRPLLVGMAVVGLIAGLLSWLQEWLLLRLNIYFSSWFMTRFVWHIMNLPLAFFDSRHSGDILMRVKSIYALTQLISSGLSSSLFSMITVFFYMMTMFFLSFKLTLLTLAIFSIILFVSIYSRKYFSPINHLLLQTYSNLTAIEIGGLRSIESLRASGNGKDFLSIRANAFAKTMQERQKLTGYEMALGFSIQSLISLMTILVIACGSLMIMNGHLTIGTLVAFQSLMIGITTPISTLTNLSAQIQQAKSNIARLRDAFNYSPIENIKSKKSLSREPNSRDILVKNVSFKYSGSEPDIISHINLQIPEKTSCAIVGKSGSGKSTLAAIITGLYHPTSGGIFIGGVNLKKLSQEEKSKEIAFVDSQTCLFEGMLYDNLTLFQANIPEKTIEEIIKLCALEDIVSSLNGIHGHIAENGLNLSGGQRQRVEIARALAQKAKVLVLDEATSAMDPILEDQIMTSLTALGLTIIIITHRLNTVRTCGQIVVMDQGSIVELGAWALHTVGNERMTLTFINKTEATIPKEADNTAEKLFGSYQAEDILQNKNLTSALYALSKHVGFSLIMPDEIKTDIYSTLHTIAAKSGVRFQEITLLQKNWWLKDHGPLLVFDTHKQQYITLLPLSSGGYRAHDDLTHQIDANNAHHIDKVGYHFFLAFPEGETTLWQIFKLSIHPSKKKSYLY